jgi:aspartate/methionine/tyrosine aminotransferase
MKIRSANRVNNVQEYYFSRKLKEIADLRNEGKDILNLGIGSPDMRPAEHVINKLISSSESPNNHAYQSYKGIPELRNAFSTWYANHFDTLLNPDNEILPLMGSKEGVMHISMAFLNEGEEVLIPNPGYPAYESVANLIGAKVRHYDLQETNNWEPNLELLEKQGLENVKIMWVNYPNMPTGKNASKQLFQKLVEFGHKHDILICNDNPYSFILNDEPLSILSIEGAKEVALELNSLSKSHNMAGWRIGMVAGDANYIQNILTVKSNMDSGMFLPVQLAAVEALNSSKNWYQELNMIYRQRRKVVWEILELLGCEYEKDQVGLFVWARIPNTYNNAGDLSDYLLYKADVFLTPGFIFGSNGEKYIRLSLCNETETLKNAKNRIQRLISKQKVAEELQLQMA